MIILIIFGLLIFCEILLFLIIFFTGMNDYEIQSYGLLLLAFVIITALLGLLGLSL